MTSKIYVVTDLGPGDGGKGGVVHKICNMMRAHTVIKRGGAQGSHGVLTSRGEKFAFSQWGCGTFDGIPTHLTEQMIISPEGLLNEAALLRYRFGIHDPFALLTVDERALCATPFHGIASRLKELARRDNPRGTIGTGVGEAYRDYRRSPSAAILAGDLKRPGLTDKLATVREQVQSKLKTVIGSEFLADDQSAAHKEIALLHDDGFLEYVAKRFAEAAGQVNIVGNDYLGEQLLDREGVAVVETSHGVLTDRQAGFHPHTSAIRTLPVFTDSLLRNAGYDGQIVHIGVTRAYAIRHGAGPLPTADPAFAERLLDGSAKQDNRYQGKVRVGPLDFVLLRYAIDTCGGPRKFDGLAVTWFDQIRTDGVWQLCKSYAGDVNFERNAALAQQLQTCSPQVTRLPIDAAASTDELYDVCAAVVKDQTDVPVRMVSFGPTELDKLCK